MRILLFVWLLCVALLPTVALAQSVPTPGAAQSEPILIINGTIHTGNGTVVERGMLGFDGGKILMVQAMADSTPLRTDFKKIIDVQGQHIYPALIACNTILGLTEIEAARATLDFAEVGAYNPNARTLVAYNTDSRIVPTVRSNGVLLAQIVPQGGVVSGASSVVQLDAWNWQDAAYNADEGVWLNFPNDASYDYETRSTKPNKDFDKEINDLHHYFSQARTHNQLDTKIHNARFDALKNIFAQTQTLYINAQTAKQIAAAIQFARVENLKICVVGASECYKVLDIIKQNNVPIVLNRLHSLPTQNDDDVLLPYKLPKLLQDAGILYCISVQGSWEVRNLPFNAGTAAAYGITPEQALQAITQNPAKILGIDQRTGTLEMGKDANFFVSMGDALDMQTNQLTHAYINGRAVNLGNKQTDLYQKFKNKYKQNK